MFRLLLRFSIRDMLWLTAAVGLAVGWLMDHRAQALQAENSFAEGVTAGCMLSESAKRVHITRGESDLIEVRPETR